MAIAKVVKIVRLGEEPSDREFWLSRPPEARLRAVEEIRREYHKWKYGAEPRLQRVHSVTQR